MMKWGRLKEKQMTTMMFEFDDEWVVSARGIVVRRGVVVETGRRKARPRI